MRHPTNDLSKTAAHFFLINYAIGGISGWPIDLRREGNATDMYVDWVRVYSAKPAPAVAVTPKPKAGLKTRGVGLNFSVGIRLLRAQKFEWAAVAIFFAVVMSVGFMRYPLLPALAVIGPISLAIALIGSRSRT